MSEMVERVARALFDPEKTPLMGWDEQSEFSKHIARRQARAAIEAMREPTTIMLEAGYPAICGEEHKVWRAMIDAALLA